MSSIYLDTAIAVFFVFFLFSVIAFVIQEWWATIREKRARMLEFAINEALNDGLNKSFGVLLYEHPQVDLMRETQSRLPAYLPARNVATALIDLIGRQSYEVRFVSDPTVTGGLLEEEIEKHDEDPFVRFKNGVSKLQYSDLKVLLESFLNNAKNLEELTKAIETWYDQYMERVTGWYRRKTRVNLRVIAAVLTVLFNIDAIYLIQNVFVNSQLRATLVSGAEGLVDDPSEFNTVIGNSLDGQLKQIDSMYSNKLKRIGTTSDQKAVIEDWNHQRLAMIDSLKELRERQFVDWVAKVNSYGLPIGWDFDQIKDVAQGDKSPTIWRKVTGFFETLQNSDTPPGMPRRTIFTVLIGWAIAATCISFGAPFWFNAISKLIQIRRTGIKPAETSDKTN